MTERLDRIEQMIENLATNQIGEHDRRLELREDLEILFQLQRQTITNLEALTAQVSALTVQSTADRALINADRAQVMADRAAEAQAKADFIAQMVGLQIEVRNILQELADMRRQQGNGN